MDGRRRSAEGRSGRVEIRCTCCGYGGVVARLPDRCPMCGARSWQRMRSTLPRGEAVRGRGDST